MQDRCVVQRRLQSHQNAHSAGLFFSLDFKAADKYATVYRPGMRCQGRSLQFVESFTANQAVATATAYGTSWSDEVCRWRNRSRYSVCVCQRRSECRTHETLKPLKKGCFFFSFSGVHSCDRLKGPFKLLSSSKHCLRLRLSAAVAWTVIKLVTLETRCTLGGIWAHESGRCGTVGQLQ